VTLARYLLVVASAGCGRFAFDPVPGGVGSGIGDGAVAGDAVPADAPGGVSSGSRLRVMMLDGDEGSVVPDTRFGLYDTMLGAPCAFEQLPDTTWACVPRDLLVGTNTYADAACTIAAATTASPAAPPRGCYTRYAVDGSDHVYATGMALPQIYRMVSGSCTAMPLATGYFSVGAEIPQSSLVPATVAVVPFGRLSYRQWVAADGARQLFDNLVDTSLDADCTIEPDIGQSDPVCGPTTVYQTRYSDAACTSPIYGPVTGTAPTTFAIDDASAGFVRPCAARTYHNVGTTMIPSAVYIQGAGGCMSLGSTGAMYVTDGGTIARTSYASGTFDRATTQRLVATSWHGSDGMVKPLPRASLFDRQLQTNCDVATDSAGNLRCVPAPDAAEDLFVDGTCTSLTYYFISCGAHSIFEQELVSAPHCGATLGDQIHTPMPATQGFVKQGASCVEVVQGSVTAAVDNAGSGAISPPATFVALTPTTE